MALTPFRGHRGPDTGLFTPAELNSLPFLRGIPNEINSNVHLSQIRKAWNRFYKSNPNPTRQDLLDQRDQIDQDFGDQFNPPC